MKKETKKQRIERALRTLEENEAEIACDNAWHDLRVNAQIGQPKGIVIQKLQKALALTVEDNRVRGYVSGDTGKPLGTRPWLKIVD